MADIRKTIGANLTELRKTRKLTQLELAARLNYSDKAISKWEHGEAMPSIEDLVAICGFYGITMDQLLQPGIAQAVNPVSEGNQRANKIVITGLSVLVIWLVATVVFVWLALREREYVWQYFLAAVPASCLVLVFFNWRWGKRQYSFAILSIMIWTLLTTVFCFIGNYRFWLIYLIGIPIQVIIIFWSRLKTGRD